MTEFANEVETERDGALRILRFAHATSLRAHADVLRLEGVVDWREEDSDQIAQLKHARTAQHLVDANLLDLQADFVEKYGLKALDDV